MYPFQAIYNVLDITSKERTSISRLDILHLNGCNELDTLQGTLEKK